MSVPITPVLKFDRRQSFMLWLFRFISTSYLCYFVFASITRLQKQKQLILLDRNIMFCTLLLWLFFLITTNIGTLQIQSNEQQMLCTWRSKQTLLITHNIVRFLLKRYVLRYFKTYSLLKLKFLSKQPTIQDSSDQTFAARQFRGNQDCYNLFQSQNHTQRLFRTL